MIRTSNILVFCAIFANLVFAFTKVHAKTELVVKLIGKISGNPIEDFNKEEMILCVSHQECCSATVKGNVARFRNIPEAWSGKLATASIPSKLSEQCQLPSFAPLSERPVQVPEVEIKISERLSVHVRNEKGKPACSVCLFLRLENPKEPEFRCSDDSGVLGIDTVGVTNDQRLEYRPADSETLYYKIWSQKMISQLKRDTTLVLWEFDEDINIAIQFYSEQWSPIFERIQVLFWVQGLSRQQDTLWDTICTSDDSGKVYLTIPKKYVTTEEGNSTFLYCIPKSPHWRIAYSNRPEWIEIWDWVRSHTADEPWEVPLEE